MKIFDTVVALQAATLTAGQLVKVKGVGEYKVETSGTGLTLANSNIAVPQAPVNVKHFGAVGDGTTDDSSAINAALSAANTAGGGTVYIPEGTYKANIVHTFGKVSLIGSGRGTVIAPASGACVAISGITNGEGSVIGGFAVSATNGATIGMSIAGYSRGRIGDLWGIDGLSTGLSIDGDASTEFKLGDIYLHNCTTVGLDYQRTDGVDTGGLYFNKLHITGSTQTAIGARFQSSHTSRTRAFAFFNQLVIDNRATEAMLVENIDSIFVSQAWLTGTIANKGMLTMRDVKDIHFGQTWCQNSDAGGYNILFSGGASSDPADDVNFNQLRTSGPGTSFQFNGSPTLTRCKISNWNDTASTDTNDATRLASMRGESFEGNVTVDGVVNIGGAVSTKTIASGIITADTSFHRVAPETGTADTLTQINGGVQGDRLLLMVNSSANTITVQHGTGNIYLDGAADKTLDNSRDKLELVYFNNEWQQVGFSSNG